MNTPTNSAPPFSAAEIETIASSIRRRMRDTIYAKERQDLESLAVRVEAGNLFSPLPIGAGEVIADLVGAVSSLDDQVGQMGGMFPDDDGSIESAINDGDEATKRADLYLKAVDSGPVQVGIVLSGGVVQSVGCSRRAPGFEVMITDYDTEGERDHEMLTMVKQSDGSGWEPAYVTRYPSDKMDEHDGVCEMRDATPEDVV